MAYNKKLAAERKAAKIDLDKLYTLYTAEYSRLYNSDDPDDEKAEQNAAKVFDDKSQNDPVFHALVDRMIQKMDDFISSDREAAAFVLALDKLNALESAGSHDLDALCNAFGALLGDVFACRDDIWAPALRAMGQGLGGFIYLMDAYDDLEKDSKKGRFNALRQLADELPPAAYEQRCHELLTQQMGRCAQPFEMLPILKNTPEGKLLYNTIYSGVWSKYALVRKHREAKRHD